jgi:hypothetical protein
MQSIYTTKPPIRIYLRHGELIIRMFIRNALKITSTVIDIVRSEVIELKKCSMLRLYTTLFCTIKKNEHDIFRAFLNVPLWKPNGFNTNGFIQPGNTDFNSFLCGSS